MNTLLHRGLFIFVLMVTHPVFAQVVINYSENLTIEEGLSNNKIYCVLQDANGFLWLGTSYGLNRYDGENVVQFVHNNTASSLPDDIVKGLLQLDKDHLLIGTGRGIAVMNLRTNSFRTVHLCRSVNANEYDEQVQLLQKDFNGKIWATTPSMIYRLDSSLHILNSYRTQTDPLRDRKNNVFKIISLPSGEELFWLSGGLYYWSPKNEKLQLLKSANKQEFKFLDGSSYFSVALANSRYLVRILFRNRIFILDTISGIFQEFDFDKKEFLNLKRINGAFDDTLSFSTEKEGFVLFHIMNNSNSLFLQPVSKCLMSGEGIIGVFTDNEGNCWAIPASGGLLKMARQKQIFHHKNLSAANTTQVKEFEISSLFPVGNTLFIGSYGGGFYTYDRVSGELEQHSVKVGHYSENMVWNFWHYQKDTLWIGTQQGLIWCCLNNFQVGRIQIPHPAVLDSFAITTLFEDSQGLVWMGVGRGNGVATYNKNSKKFNWYRNEPGGYPYRYPKKAAEDKNGNMWFISDPTGNLVKWNRNLNKFQKVVVPNINGELESESDGFFIDKKTDEIWFGLRSGRLVRYNIASGKSTVYGIPDGCTSGAVTGIVKDRSGRLWLGNTQGISCFDPGKKQFFNFLKRDGLPAYYYSSSLYYDTATDNLYAGSPGSLTWFDVKKMEKKSPPLKIFYTKLFINNKEIDVSVGLGKLKHDQNNIRIHFTGVNLSNGEENRYQYRFGEEQWVSLGNQNNITFASLNPGSYKLSIRGARKDQPFNGPPSIITFAIIPPFTQTIWFFLICLSAAITLIYTWYRYRIGYIEKLVKMRTKISHDLHDEIGSRLTNINMMGQIIRVHPGDTSTDLHLLEKIQRESEAISQSLREIVWNIDPDNDLMEEAIPRMLHFATEILESKSIVVRAQISESEKIKLGMEKRRDMFLIFKEAVHNIAKHSGASCVDIVIDVYGSFLKLQISDNGTGIPDGIQNNGNGLRYMRQRAEKHQWKLEINTTLSKGATLTLEIALK